MEHIVDKFEYSIENVNKNALFAFFENEEYTISIILSKEENPNDIVFEKLITLVIEKFLEENIYSKKNIKELLNFAIKESRYIQLEENIKEKDDINILILISDFNSMMFSTNGNYNVSLSRNEENILSSKSLNLNQNIILDKPVYLKEGDKIIIENPNLKKDSNILVNKTFSESKYIEKRIGKLHIAVGIMAIIIIYFLVNGYVVKYNIDNIEKYNKQILNMIKNNEFTNFEEVISKEKKSLNELLKKKYIYLNKAKLEKINGFFITMNNFETNVSSITKALDELKNLDNDIYNRNFETASSKYEEINVIFSSLPEEYTVYKDMINRKITSLNQILENRKRELSFVFDNRRVHRSIKELEEIISVYENSEYMINLSDLKTDLEKYTKMLEDIKIGLENRMVEAEIKKNSNIGKALIEYEEIRDILKDLDNNDQVKVVEKKIEEIKSEISYLKGEIDKNFDYALEESENKNYKLALEYLKASKDAAERLNNIEKLKEVNGKIRYIKKKIDENKVKVVKETDNKTVVLEMQKTLKLSIQKGDEYLKSNEYKYALVEYRRAIEILEKLKLDNEVKKKTLKKIEYIEKKLGKKWWQIWK